MHTSFIKQTTLRLPSLLFLYYNSNLNYSKPVQTVTLVLSLNFTNLSHLACISWFMLYLIISHEATLICYEISVQAILITLMIFTCLNNIFVLQTLGITGAYMHLSWWLNGFVCCEGLEIWICKESVESYCIIETRCSFHTRPAWCRVLYDG